MLGDRAARLLAELWSSLDGAADRIGAVDLAGPRHVLPSVFEVTALATASIGLATLAAAELLAARRGSALPWVHVHRAHAALAFRRERYARPVGRTVPPLWDPIAGD